MTDRRLQSHDDIGIERDGNVVVVELRNPPYNHFSVAMITHLADTLVALDRDDSCRCIVLAAAGRAFSAGAGFGEPGASEPEAFVPQARGVYEQAVRLFETRKPIVAAVHGAAIGGGLGLTLVADFRITCEEARFSANFARLGVHSGFGISATLPRLIGTSAASLMLLTGRRLTGAQALEMGLADRLVPAAEVRSAAKALAAEIAGCAPLAVQDMRQSLRLGLADLVRTAVARDLERQAIHIRTEDSREGIEAYRVRRDPTFFGR